MDHLLLPAARPVLSNPDMLFAPVHVYATPQGVCFDVPNTIPLHSSMQSEPL